MDALLKDRKIREDHKIKYFACQREVPGYETLQSHSLAENKMSHWKCFKPGSIFSMFQKWDFMKKELSVTGKMFYFMIFLVFHDNVEIPIILIGLFIWFKSAHGFY